MIFQHSRFQIWNANQHPFKHNSTDLLYSHPAMPGITNMVSAMNYVAAVLYPQSQPAVATPAALPALGNTINDMRTVTDDGDGKAASYRWEQREGEATPTWHKIYDLDWGTDSILQGYLLKTQDLYIKALGYDDLDAAGAPVVGVLAGQSLYGGKSASTNLTLFANSGDGVGAATGYVQMGDNVRPTATDTFDLGTVANRFNRVRSQYANIGTLALSGGIITDSSGTINFDNENLTTTGGMTAASFVSGVLTIFGALITSSSGAISFDNENLTTTGIVTANSVSALGAASAFLAGTSVADFTFTTGNIACGTATVSLNALNVTTTGNVTATNLQANTQAQLASILVSGVTIAVQSLNDHLHLQANGTGRLKLDSDADTNDISSNGTIEAATVFKCGDTYYGATSISTATNTNINLLPDGTGVVQIDSEVIPYANGVYDFGTATFLWRHLYLTGDLKNGTYTLSNATLMSLRDINASVADGMTIFWDGGAGQWVSSYPDTEVDHGAISGLGDDDHTQYALLAGRAAGQTLIGGVNASANLDIESTSHATKGYIRTKSSLVAFTDASYSGGWQGVDVGGASNRFRDFYSAGEFIGFRAQNVGALPGASANNKGRLVYLTTDDDLYMDTGGSFKRLNYNRSETDTVWNGTDTTKNVTVSDVDARRALWQLCDNTNDYERLYPSIKATSATNVLITVGTALPAGSYRLIGIE